MQKVFSKSAELEKLSKAAFSIPPFLMMENAARAIADFILSKNFSSVFIICGKGNNGGDGYALARMLMDKTRVTVFAVEEPAAQEAMAQYDICCKLQINIIKQLPADFSADVDVIVDCLYGIGFHGDLKPEIKILLDKVNQSQGLKIACDIPSGLYFRADYTFTMGEQKTSLFSDPAKDACGKIIVCNLGIPREKFESSLQPEALLIEENDIKLPFRTTKSAHKGTYGHTAVFAGEKSGAGIIAATAAMNFGSGLTTLVTTEQSNLDQFKISPELMISNCIPAKTSCVVIGPGFGKNEKAILEFANWFKQAKSPCAVIDADLITWEGLPDLLVELNKVENAKIVLTPHLSELSRFVKKYDIKTLANSPDAKIELGKELNQMYPKTAVIMKSANTFIAVSGNIFICTDGKQSLAKGGSGDILAGMTGALLAQGYSLQDAVITATEAHGLAAAKIGADAFNLTPEKLISALL